MKKHESAITKYLNDTTVDLKDTRRSYLEVCL